MKILLIAYSFPPFQDGQSLRWYYLSNALAELGIKIDVITVKHPFEDKILWNFHENIRISRIYPGPIEFFAIRAKRNIGVEDEGNRELRKSLKFRMMKSSYWGIRNLVGNILPGDIRTEWFLFARKFIRDNIDIRSYDYLITSHEPWVDSLLGLYLKRQDAKIKWIADFGDPYVAIYTPKHKLWFENYLEKLIYENASALILTNERLIDHLIDKYPSLKDKIIWVVEQGFSYGLCAARKDKGYRNKNFHSNLYGNILQRF